MLETRLLLEPKLVLRRGLQRPEELCPCPAAPGCPAASPSRWPRPPGLHCPDPPAELRLQQPSGDSWLVLAGDSRDDTKPGQGNASLAEGNGELVLKQAVVASPARPAGEAATAPRRFPTHSGSLGKHRLPDIPFNTQIL